MATSKKKPTKVTEKEREAIDAAFEEVGKGGLTHGQKMTTIFLKVLAAILFVGMLFGGTRLFINFLAPDDKETAVATVQSDMPAADHSDVLIVEDRVGTVPDGMIVVEDTAVKMPENVGSTVQVGGDGSVNVVKENKDSDYIKRLAPIATEICLKETAITKLEDNILIAYTAGMKISPELYCEFIFMERDHKNTLKD